MSNYRKLYGVLRIVDGELCFLSSDTSYEPLCDDTAIYQSRNDAYGVAQHYRGLVCEIAPELAQAYALSSPHWPHNGSQQLPELSAVKAQLEVSAGLPGGKSAAA